MRTENEIQAEMEELAAQMRDWDGNDVRALREITNEYNDLDKLLGYDTRGIFDFNDLPHGDLIPEDLRGYTSYPIWACDRRGYCLVGDDMRDIDHANTIRQVYDLPEIGENPDDERY